VSGSVPAPRSAIDPRKAFLLDRAHYPASAWATHRALWAIAAYRFAQASTRHPSILRPVTRALSTLLTLLARVATNIELPASAAIGPGLYIGHAGPIVVHANARIGRNCKMSVGVVVGSRGDNRAPTLGDDVRLGAYAVVLGDVTVGDGACVGAMTLVIDDVPAGSTVGGVPARVLKVAPAVDRAIS
jgi:serine O-acetyltransferase